MFSLLISGIKKRCLLSVLSLKNYARGSKKTYRQQKVIKEVIGYNDTGIG